MTREDVEKYAENMTYREAIYNLKQAKSIPYRKATFIKVNELLNELEQEPKISLDTYKQVTKERDIAIEQLHELGYEFGEKIEPTTKNDLALINTEGLDEGIRCAMCTNSMANDRGCDGSCVVNNAMYKKVMDVIESHIAELPSVTPQKPKAEKVIKMRDATPEERESIKKYIKSISNPTGVGFWNLEQEPTAKNDLAQERYQDLKEYFGDKETAKTILEDKKEFKAWLERVKWHVKRADELARELEALEQEPNTKNDLVVDCISRKQAIDAFPDLLPNMGYNKKAITEILQEVPSVTPQEFILDKIRAEIEQLREEYKAYWEMEEANALDNALTIIDKYKAESEQEPYKVANNLPLCEDVIHGDFMGVMDKIDIDKRPRRLEKKERNNDASENK